MHRALQELMRTATGESSFVVAVNIDIRGFSSFFSDSSQAAAFLSRAYTRILDEYFVDVSFFKPTGDGLLIVKNVTEESLTDVLKGFVAVSLRLESEFASICSNSALINFPTPPKVGIGLARGTATRLLSGDKTLDYSGLPLNLASRLMDLARPSGVVFDGSFGPDLLGEEFLAKFSKSRAYVKGIADLSPIDVFTTDGIHIPDANRTPFGATLFAEETESITFRELKTRAPHFMFTLKKRPADHASVRLEITFPATAKNGNKNPKIVRTRTIDAIEIIESGSGMRAKFDFAPIVSNLTTLGVKNPWMVSLGLAYSVPIEAVDESRDEPGQLG
jgi:class 3 adenylate cyclase